MAIWERGLDLRLHFDENLIALGKYIRKARDADTTFVAGIQPAPATGIGAPDGAHLKFCVDNSLVLMTIDSTIRTETIRAADRQLLATARVVVFKTENLRLWGQALIFMRAWHHICDRWEHDESPWTVALTRASTLKDV